MEGGFVDKTKKLIQRILKISSQSCIQKANVANKTVAEYTNIMPNTQNKRIGITLVKLKNPDKMIKIIPVKMFENPQGSLSDADTMKRTFFG